MGHANETIVIQGTPVPRVGFGTWELTGPDAVEGVRDALDAGYRHIDTARGYGNEADVGRGLAESDVARDEVFLTTKVSPEEAEPDALKAAAEDSLTALGTDHVDLLLVHWPSPDVPLERTLAAMVELREDGQVRKLGVSNFPTGLLREALELAPVFCDQVEYHPFLGQDRLRWLLEQPNVAAIPKASSRERRRENLDVFGFELSPQETREIDALAKNDRVIYPSWAPDWDA